MIGKHRGGRTLRRRLVVAVLAAAFGHGYAGRHRLADAALGRPLDLTPVGRELPEPGPLLPALEPLVTQATVAQPTVVQPTVAQPTVLQPTVAQPTVLQPTVLRPILVRSAAAAAPAGTRASGAPRLTIVAATEGPGPLADTLPHPVVSLFPVHDAPQAAAAAHADADRAVFAQVDAEREQQATVELAGGPAARPAGRGYRARHIA